MPLNDIAVTIGANVRAGRSSMGLTRKQLASAADVSERHLHELENGQANVSIGILCRIASALSLELASLIADAPAPPAPGDDALAKLLAGMSPDELAGAIPILTSYLDARRKLTRGIALMGLRGAGKTTLGRKLAEHQKLEFVSVTREIEARAGMGLADLFNLGGPDGYRALENEVVADLCRRSDRIVLETAGGIVGNPQALDRILASFRTVWLKASPEEHLVRVAGQGDTRPMRGNPKALEHLRTLLSQREPEYARAQHVIDTSGRTIDACLAELEAIALPP